MAGVLDLAPWVAAGIVAANGGPSAAWVTDALCAETDPEVFFPGKGQSPNDAKKVCRRCAVSEECLIYALVAGQKDGVWGGTTERQRRKMPLPEPPAVTVTVPGPVPGSQPQAARTTRIVRMGRQGMPVAEIAGHVGCKPDAVRAALARAGVRASTGDGQLAA